MLNQNSWSIQSLTEQTFTTKDEAGKEVHIKNNVLTVCISGIELYKKHFLEDKYKGKDRLVLPYDFILLGGDLCPRGEFYEIEYQTADDCSVYRALIQCVDPVTDLRIMLGCLKRNNILPDSFKPLRAWLRSDIDKVYIASCVEDKIGEIIVNGAYYGIHDDRMDERPSVEEYTMNNRGQCCLYYYRGDHREYWVNPSDTELIDPIFVCGVNGNDPEFAEKKEADMEELQSHLDEAMSIARDYDLPHFVFVVTKATEDGKLDTIYENSIKLNVMQEIITLLQNGEE